MDYTGEVKDLSGDVKLITNAPAFVGPYSIVYHGYLKSSGQLVAVKRMNGIRGATARTIRRKVQREGWAWSLLLHRNILPFYGYIEDDERFQPYGAFVSPWCRRGDLGQYLQENPSAHLADRLKIGVVDGVAYLHGYSPVVIHGDLKPGNILVDDDGSTKICDFGLARVIMEEGKSGLTTTTAHTGTSRYLAYELVMAEVGIPTTSSDIYAAGCIGLEVIFRKIPYSHRINGNNLLWNIRSDMQEGRFPANRPVESLVHSDPIWKLVMWCWAREPVSRAQAHELSARLEEILTPVNTVTHLGPTPLPSTTTQLQAGIHTHTPEGDIGPTAFRMEIDTDHSSRQSGLNSLRDQDPETVSFVDHGVHQEIPQGSGDLDNTAADIITEIDMNSAMQGGAANAPALLHTHTQSFAGSGPNDTWSFPSSSRDNSIAIPFSHPRDQNSARCPSCSASFEGRALDGWVQCPFCSTQFQIETQVQVEPQVWLEDTTQSDEEPLRELVTPEVQSRMREATQLQFHLISVTRGVPSTPSPSHMAQDFDNTGVSETTPTQNQEFTAWEMLEAQFKAFNTTPGGPVNTCGYRDESGVPCGKTIPRQDRFKHHVQAHFGVKPYACADSNRIAPELKCDRRFSSVAERDTHVRNKVPVVCHCTKEIQPRNLARHQKTCFDFLRHSNP